MSRDRHSSTVLRLPGPVAQWLGTMSARVGAPAHRVLQVLLDDYADRLPEPLRQRLEEQVRRRREGGRRPH
jgi:hypothetical protein